MDLNEFINDLQRRLEDGEEEVFIEVDGVQYDFDIEHQDATFDGFYTSYPACCVLRPKPENE